MSLFSGVRGRRILRTSALRSSRKFRNHSAFIAIYYCAAMTLRTLTLLAATAMAVLVAGCGSSQQEDGSNSQHGRGSQHGSSSQQRSEAENLISADACTGSGGADHAQEAPGEISNGTIAFFRTDADVTDLIYGVYTSRAFVIDEDGTNETPLADDPATRFGPAWSPDGEQIAFLRSPTKSPDFYTSSVFVIDADGTNERRLTQTESVPETKTALGWPVWSPEGNKIAFSSSGFDRTPSSASAESTSSSTSPAEKITGIYVIDVKTAGLCKLTSTAESPIWWSPEGNKIAFYDEPYHGADEAAITVINSDGSGRKELTGDLPAELSALEPAPDGEKIAFVKDPGPYGTNPDGSLRRLPNKEAGLYVINPDGSGLRRLANTLEPSPAGSPITWSPDSEKIAFSCPAAPGAVGTDLCVMNADGTEWKRIAHKVAPEDVPVSSSWGRK
jgi:Tol biopolymer transport system component